MCLPLMLWLFTYVWVSPHYAAPGAAAYFIFGAVVLRRLFHAWPVATQYLVAFILLNAVWQYRNPRNQWLSDKREHIAARKAVIRKLDQAPSQKVVLVEYAPGHDEGADVNQEWIFNHADIDRSPIVWAHDMGPERNQELIDYYRGRQFWRLVAYAGGKVELMELTPARGVQPSPIK
jgi:hypothetical protein